MSKLKWDASLLRLVMQHLRVPELIYPFELASSDALSERKQQTNLLLERCKLSHSDHEETLIRELQKVFSGKGSHTQANNLAFLLDRVFDVWLRKNNFSSQLNIVFSKWRFIFYKCLLLTYATNLDQNNIKIREKALENFSTTLESIAEYAKNWSPIPKRSQSILLEQLASIESLFDAQQDFDELFMAQCASTWLNFLEKQKEKVEKITQRLIISESKKNRSQFCHWLAYHYLNILFNKRRLPQVLQDFLQEYWVLVVAKKIENNLPDSLDGREAIIVGSYHEDLDLLCKNIVRVFCHKGESGFQLADQIIEDLQKMSKDINLPSNIFISESEARPSAFFSIDFAWDALSEALLALLQDHENEEVGIFRPLIIPEHLKQIYGSTEQFKADIINFSDLKLSVGDWYIFNDQGELLSIKLISCFKQSQQLLFSNYLGMKSAQFSFQNFKERLADGSLKKMPKGQAFLGVFDQAVKGLSKVAETQKQARLIAAEKAKAEAERLLEDRRKSDEMASQRAKEIAQHTQNLLAKRADKQRIEKDNATLDLIRSFKLGAWIAIQDKDDAEPQRFKLVVKLAATGKYVFVDRLGVRRKEFLETDLMEAIQSNHIVILSDGAEFEDSLQRVVSRLRMSK
jgi:transcription elongation GreA/GreB family factor